MSDTETKTIQVPTVMDPKLAEAIKEKILQRRSGVQIAPMMKGYSKVKK